MINFTVGPVQSSESVHAIGAQDVPYFRTAEFSEVMLENERLMLKFAGAPEGSRAVFITGSGTASMEAAVMNLLTSEDRALVVNGGSFGARFCKICEVHGVPHDEIRLDAGKALTREKLTTEGTEHTESMEGGGDENPKKTSVTSVFSVVDKKYTAFVVNMHETSTGVLYDMRLIADYCKANGLLLIVDCISSFLCDEFDMAALGADVMITGSQKALACPPGVSIIVLSPRALERVASNDPKCLYFDLKDALKNQERGQTPFTPAVGTLLQINARLKEIDANGGVSAEIAKAHGLAEYFRSGIKDLPLEIVSESLSNAVTPLRPTNGMSAYDIFLKLKDEHGIWVCPNGGELKDKVFRVGHMGCLTTEDYDKLLLALREVMI
ncbi:MAG: alanine--glyoxylate aminotransferase family protein [Kiritimatiellae bacterium]|nr:alanine--glyoxylate aminotransferase family protein [Kiritimatiellia bacterium]